MSNSKPDLTVAVLTYRRPDDLTAILPALAIQLTSVADRVERARILVVDNSPEGAALEQVSVFGSANHWKVQVDYENETTPGIPAARNRALDASRNADLLVFIDDDERPSDRWLLLLLASRAEYEACAVVGAVVSEYAIEPSVWIAAGRFFDRRRLPTGTRLTVAATNNLLIDLATVRSARLRFDEKMGLNGGDDTLFTRELARLGRMVWCDEAVVVDVVPAQRITKSWVVRRALRSGNSWALTSVRLASGPLGQILSRVRAGADGLIRLAGGSALVLAGLLSGSISRRARGTRTAARGAGMLLGAVGLSYLEYSRPEAGSRRIAIARR